MPVDPLAKLDRAGADERPLSTPTAGPAASAAQLPVTSAAAVLVAVAIFRLPELFGSVQRISPRPSAALSSFRRSRQR